MQSNSNKFYKFLFTVLFLFAQQVAAQQVKEMVLEADSLFEAKSYSEAFEIYESLLKEGAYTPQMLARMAYVQEGFGNTAQALYYLTLLNRYSPNEATLRKLEKLSEENGLQGYSVSDQSYFYYLYRRYRLETLLALSALALAGAGLLYWANKRGYSPMAPGAVLIAYCLLVGWLANFQAPDSQAIVTGEQAYVMDRPSAGGRLVTSLNAGHRLSVIQEQDIWYEVEWEGQRAFIRGKNLKLVE